MRNKRSDNVRRVAATGVMAAFSVAVMYIATLTGAFELCGCVFAAMAVVFVYIEYGTKTALTLYSVVSVLCLLILPNKFTAALYVLFAGYYPIIKARLERLTPLISWILKIISFNLILTALLLAAKHITYIEFEAPVISITIYAGANGVFILSDLLASNLIGLYLKKYRDLLIKRGLI